MSQEILSIKLCELEQQLSDMKSRIRRGSILSDERLQEEIKILQLELADKEKALFHGLAASKMNISPELRECMDSFCKECGMTFQELTKEVTNEEDQEWQMEKQLLFAEYGIDFAVLIANQSLLLALEAIENDRKIQKED